MAKLDWNLGGGGSSGGESWSSSADERQNPEVGLTGEEGSTDTGSTTIGVNSDGWDDIDFGGSDDSGSGSGSGSSSDSSSGIDERANPDSQLRWASGLDDDSTGTGSTIVTSGGDPAAGSVTVDPDRTTPDVTDDDGSVNEEAADTMSRLVDSVTRERNQDNREDNDIPTAPGSNGPADDEAATSLDVLVREGDGGLDPAVAVGLLVLAGLVFGGE